MSRIKVLFMIHTLQIGGAERVFVDFINNLDKKKYDITVMTVVNTGAFRNELSEEVNYGSIIDLSCFRKKKNSQVSNKKSGNLLSGTSILKSIISKIYLFFWRHIDCKKIYRKKVKNNYDVEIAFLEGVSAKIIANSSNEKSKKIAWIHVDLLNERKTEKFFKNYYEEKETYNSFDKVVCVSNDVREQFIKKFDYLPDKVIVRYNPIDENKIIEMSKEGNLKYNKNKFTLCSIGRLSTQKAFDRLINCTYKLKREGFIFDVWIIGVGSEEAKLKKLVIEYKLNNVKFLGYQKNPYKYLVSADLIVCSSIAEGFSTVISEAVILGKPIVTTDCSGMKEMLGENSEYGLICKNSEEGLYLALKSLLTDKNKYIYYKDSVKKRKDFFSLSNSVKKIEELIDVTYEKF